MLLSSEREMLMLGQGNVFVGQEGYFLSDRSFFCETGGTFLFGAMFCWAREKCVFSVKKVFFVE